MPTRELLHSSPVQKGGGCSFALEMGLLLGLLVLWETVTLMEGTITQKINRCWENPDKDQEPSKRTCHMLALQRIRPVLSWHK
ncbi:zinc finger DHHC-type palmitoyltransferase 19 [Rhinolophus ferrumequinum]|uniref:Zinc finger DHHC-type palmitoyltransferase 19 n=1 Tax=Rhinolophus ferrumequinum TaxID=59479 RepID=A0A7J8AHB5_RHIFE|nr:zinc finger DHHC-type palmitoyltransferase 19 [Rhinolophus ferrumequinum]